MLSGVKIDHAAAIFSAPSEEFNVGDLRRWKVISIKLKCIFKLIVFLRDQQLWNKAEQRRQYFVGFKAEINVRLGS